MSKKDPYKSLRCKECSRIYHHHLCSKISFKDWLIEMGHDEESADKKIKELKMKEAVKPKMTVKKAIEEVVAHIFRGSTKDILNRIKKHKSTKLSNCLLHAWAPEMYNMTFKKKPKRRNDR